MIALCILISLMYKHAIKNEKSRHILADDSIPAHINNLQEKIYSK